MITVIVEILLEVGGFDMDRGTELTVINVHMNIQECDIGGVPCEVDGRVTVEPFKKWW